MRFRVHGLASEYQQKSCLVCKELRPSFQTTSLLNQRKNLGRGVLGNCPTWDVLKRFYQVSGKHGAPRVSGLGQALSNPLTLLNSKELQDTFARYLGPDKAVLFSLKSILRLCISCEYLYTSKQRLRAHIRTPIHPSMGQKIISPA